MAVFAYAAAPHAERRALEEAGARLFRRMSELPALLGQ
jgi:hypothetical protein